MRASFTMNTLAASLLLALLAGCGGGGGSDSDSGSSSSSSSGSSGSSSSSSSGTDALNFAQVNYTFSCQGVSGTTTVQVANGPCLSQQKSYVKATSCNEYDSDFTFKSTGKPFYQCAVNNTTNTASKSAYQQMLTYFSK